MKYLNENDASDFVCKLENLMMLQRQHAELKSEIHDIEANKILKWEVLIRERPAPYDDGPEEEARKNKIKKGLAHGRGKDYQRD